MNKSRPLSTPIRVRKLQEKYFERHNNIYNKLWQLVGVQYLNMLNCASLYFRKRFVKRTNVKMGTAHLPIYILLNQPSDTFSNVTV